MTSVKKIKVALLALVAALVIAIPTSAFAADNSIEITGLSSNHTFEAYQIFKGDITEGALSNIDWGTGVSQVQLEAALAGTSFEGMSATDVAQRLNGLVKDDPLAKEFAEAITNALSSTYITLEEDSSVKGKYTNGAASVADGYYLIKDKDDSLSNLEKDPDAYTRYILGVAGKIQEKAKASIPTVEKDVLEDREGGDWGDTGDFSIGQEISYRLTGTLPSTYDDYDWYKYIFHDTFSKGLDFVRVDSIVDDKGNDLSSYFTSVFANQKLTITANDNNGKYLKAATVLTKDSKIIVTYTAKLNADAVVGEPGNENDVYLEFSNNPNKDHEGDTDETETDRCIVFTYGVDNLKKGEGADAAYLANAKFILKRAYDAKIDGTFEDSDAQKAAEEAIYYGVFDTNFKLTSWSVGDKDAATRLVSDAQGKFTFKGIDEGTYTLEETEAPTNYSLMNDFTFTIESVTSIDETTNLGKIDTLKMNTKEDNTPTDGMTYAEHNNKVSVNLPSTGGIGTTIFYIVGAALILAAAITMVVRRRNAAAQQ